MNQHPAPSPASQAADEHDRFALWSLLYAGFLFVNWENASLARWLPPTLLTLAVFVPAYVHVVRRVRGRGALAAAALFALLTYALLPFNVSANTYLIYAAALLPLGGLAPRWSLLAIGGAIALLGIEAAWLGWPLRYAILVTVISAIIACAVYLANHFAREKALRQAELKLSHDEVRRLAALAERERIGRDLHDLLGHTLSLITLKAELANRLLERDPAAARREMAEVERVARDALAQVRRAVSGIRAAGLAAELAAARLLLESGDVQLDYRLGETALPPAIETVLALVVREAITNIQRHAHASRARVELTTPANEAHLLIEDDGRGGAITPGNGLSGMRERLAACGGRLEIDSARGTGTRLRVVVPLPPPGAALDEVPSREAHA